MRQLVLMYEGKQSHRSAGRLLRANYALAMAFYLFAWSTRYE